LIFPNPQNRQLNFVGLSTVVNFREGEAGNSLLQQLQR